MADQIYMSRSAWTELLDAIREKGGTSALMTSAQAKAAIEAISGGGGGWTADEIATSSAPNGDIVLSSSVQKIQQYAFAFSPITSVIAIGDFNSVSNTVQNGAFRNCTSLKRISFPNWSVVNTGNSGQFQNCTSLTSVSVPKLPRVLQNMFASCTSLTVLDFPSVTAIVLQAFQGSTALTTIILRSNSVVSLDNINAFNNTPFASGKSGGTLYVPSDLIADYQAATNWSTILGYATNSIVAIEGSEYDT